MKFVFQKDNPGQSLRRESEGMRKKAERTGWRHSLPAFHFFKKYISNLYYVPNVVLSPGSRVVNKRCTASWRAPSGYEGNHQATQQQVYITIITEKRHEKHYYLHSR